MAFASAARTCRAFIGLYFYCNKFLMGNSNSGTDICATQSNCCYVDFNTLSWVFNTTYAATHPICYGINATNATNLTSLPIPFNSSNQTVIDKIRDGIQWVDYFDWEFNEYAIRIPRRIEIGMGSVSIISCIFVLIIGIYTWQYHPILYFLKKSLISKSQTMLL